MTVPTLPPTDPTLTEALARITDLAERLWAVRAAHHPAPRSAFRRRTARCAACGWPHPCPTLVAAWGGRMRELPRRDERGVDVRRAG